MTTLDATGTAVAVLADDLIWSTRLADAVSAAGGMPVRLRRAEDLAVRLGAVNGAAPRFVIVDLTARAYDGVAAIEAAKATGARIVAVGQHDDAELRKRALEAGAERVFSYRALFEAGARHLATWLGR